MKISVILCTHNPRLPILRRVLAALQGQTLDPQSWELIVVDNASDPPVSEELVAPFAAGRPLREERLGSSHARRAGLAAAEGDLLVFVDDDNVLELDYLANTSEIAQNWPMLGAWGGRILPEFERTPPDWTRRYWDYLAIRDCPVDCWSNSPGSNQEIPAGAGSSIRRCIATVYSELLERDPVRLLLGRTGAALTGHEDYDLALTACDLGYGVARFSSLKLWHYMPAGRLEEQYLLRIVEGAAYSSEVFDAIRGKRRPRTSRLRWARSYLAGWKLSPRDRRFWHAQQRGLRRAGELISQNPALQGQRDARHLAHSVAEELGVSAYQWTCEPHVELNESMR